MRRLLDSWGWLIGPAVLVLLILWASRSPAQTDVRVSGRSAYTVIARGRPWGSGLGAMNNNFLFYPVTADSTICVYITNNNPTNLHSVSLAVAQTGDPQQTSFTVSTGRWANVPSNQSFPVNIAANSTSGFYFKSNAAAYLALQISGTSTAAGSPDTADIFAVMPSTQSSCGITSGAPLPVIGSQVEGSTELAAVRFPVLVGGHSSTGGGQSNTVDTISLDTSSHGVLVGLTTSLSDPTVGYNLQLLNGGSGNTSQFFPVLDWGVGDDSSNPAKAMSFKNSRRFGLATSNIWAWSGNWNGTGQAMLQSYFTSQDATNPAAGQILVAVNEGGTSPGVNPYRVWLVCSAACDVLINKTSTAGTGCTAITASRAFEGSSGAAAQNTVSKGCTTAPIIEAQIFHPFLAANTPQVYDLTGYWQGVASGVRGFDVVQGTALTGTVSVNIEWAER